MAHSTNSAELRKLTRTQLQSLAKREGIRAVGKTVDIVRRLLRKHPGGVPVSKDADNPSPSPETPKRSVLKKFHKGTSSSLPLVPGTPKVRTTPKDEPAAGPSNINPAPHAEVAEPEALVDHPVSLSGQVPPTLPPGPPHQVHSQEANRHDGVVLPKTSNPGWRADEEDQPEDTYDDVDYPKGAPTHYMVVDALRQFTTLVNTIPSMETRIAESRCLLQRAETMLDKAIPDARELVVTREYLETFLLGKMKQKRELWDGTAKMNKQDRKLRMEWLRAERKAENEKRWREANELYRKYGLKPEPFSAFAYVRSRRGC
ncbi:hypothetical protein V8E55_011247 [Tylopilus felleus]